MTSRRNLLTMMTLFGALGGCVSLTPPNARVIRGRFSLTAKLAEKRVAQSGRFECAFTDQMLRLDLLTPLSGIVARLESSPKGASLSRSAHGDEVLSASSLDELSRQAFGFSIPAEALASAVRQEGALPNLSRLGPWVIQVLERTPDGTPSRLRISNPQSQPTVLLTILMDSNDQS